MGLSPWNGRILQPMGIFDLLLEIGSREGTPDRNRAREAAGGGQDRPGQWMNIAHAAGAGEGAGIHIGKAARPATGGACGQK